MELAKLESKYKYKYSKFFKQLWDDGMLDWMDGKRTVFSSGETWENTVYPKIKENPKVLLHTGGMDFEMLTYDDMLNFKFDEFWDIDKHTFIPFAKTDEGIVYAFYNNIKTDGESAVVCIWNDMNETEVLAKNFEDFIFRKMIEAVYDIDNDELDADYKETGFDGYRKDILNDLKTISPYLKEEYVEILTDIYNRENVIKSMISCSLISRDEFSSLIQKELDFEELNAVFEHEAD
jgi:hypothetical protein